MLTLPARAPLSLRADVGAGAASVALADPFADKAAFGVDFPSHTPYGLAGALADLYLAALDHLRPGMGTFLPLMPAIPDCNATVAGTAFCAAARYPGLDAPASRRPGVRPALP